MIDLHTHSTFSDGSFSPTELVRQAREAGLSAVALTDHDSTAGIAEFLAAGRRPAEGPPECIPGVEISAAVQQGTMHILGYFIDPAHEELGAVLARIRRGRDERNHKILERLDALNMRLTLDEVAAFAGDEVVGRPHVASALIARGYVRSKAEAFGRYLAKGKRAYVDRFRLSPRESIRVLREAGGVPVLAHPGTLDLGPSELRKAVGKFRQMGLEGIEVYYPEHKPDAIQEFLTLVDDFDLVATGGTDFHGAGNPDMRLGVGFGSLCVPDRLVQPLRRRSGARGDRQTSETAA